MGNYEIVYYSKPNGREPLREFLESLSPKLSSEAFSDLATLREMGPELRMPHSRHIRKGLFELRIQADGTTCGRSTSFIREGASWSPTVFSKRHGRLPFGKSNGHFDTSTIGKRGTTHDNP